MADTSERQPRLSTRRITSTQTYDPTDCTTVGWDVTLYSDGHLAAESWSCWQGSTSGERWITAAGRVDYREPSDPETTADDQAHVEMLAEVERFTDCRDGGQRGRVVGAGWTEDGWRLTRRGYVVQ